MNIIQKTPGLTVDYKIDGTKITFADDTFMLNLAKYERDYPVHIDICSDKSGMLVTGVIPGVADKYAAEIDIPAGRYVYVPGMESENEDAETLDPVPFDMDLCTLYLWGLEGK